ncbi:hypothetical protein G6F58_013427 [Rhizopus delemar]|nr:hypothetical protein G6F58_013427 [Rhizopus delemar]
MFRPDACFLRSLQVQECGGHPGCSHHVGIVESLAGLPFLHPGQIGKALQHGCLHHPAPAFAQLAVVQVQRRAHALVHHGDRPDQAGDR